MPTIELSESVLSKLSKRSVKQEDLYRAKSFIEEKKDDSLKIEVSDTNRPDLWSVEGIARVLREKNGCPALRTTDSGKKIVVSKDVLSVRPYISGFIAKNIGVPEELLKSLVQMQEKLSDNFGKKRKKVSIGIYNHDKIKFPVHYKLVSPETRFVPLGFENPHSLREVLQKHPKGLEYGFILKDREMFPIFVDSKNGVLSFPPIINSNYLGRIEPGTKNIFVEVTGTDKKAVLLTANIVAFALYDRGCKIESVDTIYPIKTIFGAKVRCPYHFNDSFSFKKSLVESVLGIVLKDSEITKYLRSMQYDVEISRNTVTVKIPDYRNDIMHSYDIIEDIAISYGYENFHHKDTSFFTLGRLSHATDFSEKIKNILIGLGFQEIMTPVLSNRKNMEERMCTSTDSVEIENVMSENYSAVRSWLLPSLINFLTKNMHVDYPHFIFEVGECEIKNPLCTRNKIAALISGNNIGYQNMSSVVDAFMKQLGVYYRFERLSHPSFIEGRAASILCKKEIGFIGEIHPAVLNNWSLEKPVVAFEIDLDELNRLYSKK